MATMSATSKAGTRQRTIENFEIIKRFTLEIYSISSHLGEVHQIWGKGLGISGPQWMILIAVSDLDKGDGVPVNVVSKLLRVDSSFVAPQSKVLERKGLLRRVSSSVDARVVKMSLTKITRKHLASLGEQFSAIREFVFEEFDEKELTAFTGQLATLNKRLEKVCLRIASGLDFSIPTGCLQGHLEDDGGSAKTASAMSQANSCGPLIRAARPSPRLFGRRTQALPR